VEETRHVLVTSFRQRVYNVPNIA